MKPPDYIVLRAGLDLPDGWMPEELDGRWYNRNRAPRTFGYRTGIVAVAEPTGRFEVRDDGAVAEVWEIRPGYKVEGQS